jgi:hypothetical protein
VVLFQEIVAEYRKSENSAAGSAASGPSVQVRRVLVAAQSGIPF